MHQEGSYEQNTVFVLMESNSTWTNSKHMNKLIKQSNGIIRDLEFLSLGKLG